MEVLRSKMAATPTELWAKKHLADSKEKFHSEVAVMADMMKWLIAIMSSAQKLNTRMWE